jgi:serine/threonine protein kinase
MMLLLSLFIFSNLLQSSISFPWMAPISMYEPTANNSMLRRPYVHLQQQNVSKPQPRVLYLGGDWVPGYQPPKRLLDAQVVMSTDVDQDAWQPASEHCLPKADWQIKSFPNCNSIHEINIVTSAAENSVEEDSLSVLGEGWFRTTWRFDRSSPHDESVVLKTLRIEREYLSEYYELHRRDAVAMERLTASAFIVDIYGYCGQSAINELANFPFPGIQSLESFNRRMRGKESAKTNSIKLRMAASIALGVADIHAAGSTDPDDENVYMAHYDLNPRNIALFAGGRPKINDFNIAEFLRYDPDTNETCKFPSRLHEPWWRAPEEMNMTHTALVDEKVDVYALGNILYHTLTTHSARGKQQKERMDEVRPIVAAGIRPVIPELYTNDEDPKVKAMVKAINVCWSKDPAERATADVVAAILYEALLNKTDTAVVEEKVLDEQAPPGSVQDDDTPEDTVEDKNAMGHTAV